MASRTKQFSSELSHANGILTRDEIYPLQFFHPGDHDPLVIFDPVQPDGTNVTVAKLTLTVDDQPTVFDPFDTTNSSVNITNGVFVIIDSSTTYSDILAILDAGKIPVLKVVTPYVGGGEHVQIYNFFEHAKVNLTTRKMVFKYTDVKSGSEEEYVVTNLDVGGGSFTTYAIDRNYVRAITSDVHYSTKTYNNEIGTLKVSNNYCYNVVCTGSCSLAIETDDDGSDHSGTCKLYIWHTDNQCDFVTLNYYDEAGNGRNIQFNMTSNQCQYALNVVFRKVNNQTVCRIVDDPVIARDDDATNYGKIGLV